ncbi:MAG: response regulator [Epsilonproteobacteria bacterium]|nr:response regulator [Campylobacterota bacterium]
MRVVIVENEIYLAQSIASKLADSNYETIIHSSVKEALNSNGDVYLISTTMPGQNCLPLIEKFKDKIIILMVNYINNDTVGEPLKRGAKDYIVKPFMIEELERKIEHYRLFQKLENKNIFFLSYLKNLFEEIEVEIEKDNLKPPLVIYTNYQRSVDKVIFERIDNFKEEFIFIPLNQPGWLEKIQTLQDNQIGYITYLESLKKDEREKLFLSLEGKKFFLTSNNEEIQTPYESIRIKSSNKLFDQNDILTIDEYIQYIIKNFQNHFPDTELSKKLGISRKSLWEKRKKYGLFKKK